MTEGHLHVAYVGATVEHLGRDRVPQEVRVQVMPMHSPSSWRRWITNDSSPITMLRVFGRVKMADSS